MNSWLIENTQHIALGLVSTVGLGLITFLTKKSWAQSVKLYQDKLIQCQSREVGYIETIAQKDRAIAQRDEDIAFRQRRSEYREQQTEELIAEVGSLRSAAERAIATTRTATEPHSN